MIGPALLAIDRYKFPHENIRVNPTLEDAKKN